MNGVSYSGLWTQCVDEARALTSSMRAEGSSPWAQLRIALQEEGCDPATVALGEHLVSAGGDHYTTISLCTQGHAFKLFLADQPTEDYEPRLTLVESRYRLISTSEIDTASYVLAAAAQVLHEEGSAIDPISYLCRSVGFLDDHVKQGTDFVGTRFPSLLDVEGIDFKRGTVIATNQSFGRHPRGWLALLDETDHVIELSVSADDSSIARRGLSEVEALERYGPWLAAARRLVAGECEP